MSINFGDLLKAADEAGPTVLPASWYDVEVATAEAKVTQNGKNQIAATLTVIEGPYRGKKVFNNFVISPENGNALRFFFQHMAVLGLPRTWFAANPPLADTARQIVGKRCRVQLSTRIWNGTERNQVDKLEAIPGSVPGAPPIPVPAAAPAPIAAPPPPPPLQVPVVSVPPQPPMAPPAPLPAPAPLDAPAPFAPEIPPVVAEDDVPF